MKTFLPAVLALAVTATLVPVDAEAKRAGKSKIKIRHHNSEQSMVWTAPAKNDVGVWFTAVMGGELEGSSENMLSVLANPENSCDLQLAYLEGSDAESDDEEYSYSGPIAHFKVDKESPWAGESSVEGAFSDNGDWFYTRVYTPIGLDVVAELSVGTSAIYRLELEDDEYTDTFRFPLTGSATAIRGVIQACDADEGEWGESNASEWKSNQSNNEWES